MIEMAALEMCHPGFSGPFCRVVQVRSHDVAVISVISEYGAYSRVWSSKQITGGI